MKVKNATKKVKNSTKAVSEKDLRLELKQLRIRLEAVESLLLEIESKKPDLGIDEYTRIRQARCKHRKGGKLRFGISHKDYAIRLHTFIDGSKQGRCTLCGKIWTPEGKEWFKFLEMLEETTNVPSSSEVLSVVTPFAPAEPREAYSVMEVKDAYRPRNENEENPIRGRK